MMDVKTFFAGIFLIAFALAVLTMWIKGFVPSRYRLAHRIMSKIINSSWITCLIMLLMIFYPE